MHYRFNMDQFEFILMFFFCSVPRRGLKRIRKVQTPGPIIPTIFPDNHLQPLTIIGKKTHLFMINYQPSLTSCTFINNFIFYERFNDWIRIEPGIDCYQFYLYLMRLYIVKNVRRLVTILSFKYCFLRWISKKIRSIFLNFRQHFFFWLKSRKSFLTRFCNIYRIDLVPLTLSRLGYFCLI